MTSLHRSILIAAWLLLGAIFIYLGLVKVVDPVAFLKVVRLFDVMGSPLALNLVAAVLPWFEVFCGVLLLSAVKARAAAALQFAMLTVFTVLVIVRAFTLHQQTGVAFWLVRFDCGCGSGEIIVWAKLLENLGMMFLAGLLIAAGGVRTSTGAGSPDRK